MIRLIFNFSLLPCLLARFLGVLDFSIPMGSREIVTSSVHFVSFLKSRVLEYILREKKREKDKKVVSLLCNCPESRGRRGNCLGRANTRFDVGCLSSALAFDERKYVAIAPLYRVAMPNFIVL